MPKTRGKNKKGSFFRVLFIVFGLAGMGWGLLAGCSNHTPFDAGYPGLTPTPNVTPVYPAPTTVPNRALVANFNGGSPQINPNLLEMGNPPSYVLKTPGAVTAVNNFPSDITLSTYAPQATSSGLFPYAFHVQGTLTDPANASYPAVELEAQMEGGSQYNGSFFSGVEFYLLVSSADNTTKRDFSIPVLQTQGPPQGTCTGANGTCYDNFAINLSPTPGQWTLFTIPFNSLTQAYAGVVTNPPTFTGANLQQMLWLQWEEGRNNMSGTSTIDYWVGDIQFY